MMEGVMITTRYNWRVDRRRKIIFNQYGLILREGPTWYFRESYFDQAWSNILTESPLGGCRSLQTLLRDVESCISRYKEFARRRWHRRFMLIAAYTCILAVISVSMIFAWAKALGY
jgi:hypothetical protein